MYINVFLHKELMIFVYKYVFQRIDDLKLNFLLRVTVVPETLIISATVAQLVEQRIRNDIFGDSFFQFLI